MGLGASVGMCWGLNVWWEFSCMDMCLCSYDEWFCNHLPTHSPSLQLCVLWTTCMCTTLQWVSITANITTDIFPIASILQQVLRLVRAYNALYSKGKYTGWGGWSESPMLTSPQQALGLCNHVYSTCLNARTLFSPHTIMFSVCTWCVIYMCMRIGHTICHWCSVYVCVYMCVWFVLNKFVFHIVACVCFIIINGAAQNSHHTHFYSSLQLCVLWTMCTTLQDVSVIEQVSIVALPLSYDMFRIYCMCI